VIDSMLSEYAVLGFEYGYSLAEPNALVMWEAQFGDFANGAQIMFDQFICSGERKWLRMSGLVMLLPHGFEGQGPEHSSARLERFLQMCAEDNWIVANCTTPANYFHILRRQLHRGFRKPLVLMTPKSLSAAQAGVSDMEEFTEGLSSTGCSGTMPNPAHRTTKLVADDKIRRVVMCSGKVYYDLLEERDARGIDDVYLLRVEQFYPFPALSLMKELERFKAGRDGLVPGRAQEPGRLDLIEPNLEWVLGRIGAKHTRPRYVGRAASASPATGSASQHKAQQAALVNEALTIEGRRLMAIEVRVPTLGESVTEATVAPPGSRKPGDAVEADEMLCELETDKVTVEVPAPGGHLGEIVAAKARRWASTRCSPRCARARPAATASARRPIAGQARAAPEAGEAGGESVDVMVPTLGESVTEATVATWFKKRWVTRSRATRCCASWKPTRSRSRCRPRLPARLTEILPTKAARCRPAASWPHRRGWLLRPGGRRRHPRNPGRGEAGRRRPPGADGAPRRPEDGPAAKKAMAEAGLTRDQVRAPAATAG
jgi:biotin carboxyl carrier protein